MSVYSANTLADRSACHSVQESAYFRADCQRLRLQREAQVRILHLGQTSRHCAGKQEKPHERSEGCGRLRRRS